LLTGAISFYPNLLSLVKMNLVDGRTGGSLQGVPWISVARQVWLKRTALTCGRLPFAVPLSDFDQERVKLIKKPLIGRQMPVQKLLRGRIAVLLGNQEVPCKYTARIGISHKKRQLAGVEEDSVNSLWTHAAKGQQLGASHIRRLAK
jgi:hypothetical protein